MASSGKPVVVEPPHKLTKSEEEFGQKVDRCLLDSVVKVGSGIGLGIVFSVVLFRSNFLYIIVKRLDPLVSIKEPTFFHL
jgi:hypothetical protein